MCIAQPKAAHTHSGARPRTHESYMQWLREKKAFQELKAAFDLVNNARLSDLRLDGTNDPETADHPLFGHLRPGGNCASRIRTGPSSNTTAVPPMRRFLHGVLSSAVRIGVVPEAYD